MRRAEATGDPVAPQPAELLYLQVARTLREEILAGDPAPGERLPSEAALAERFGVARTSVREALRVLVSQGLVRTQRGATGGSTVTALSHEHARELLQTSLRSMTVAEGATEEEMAEVRELLDVTATWLAATRRTPSQVQALRASIPDVRPGRRPTPAQVAANLQFHYLILEAAGNRLLHLFGEPVSVVIYSFFRTHEHRSEYYAQVHEDHLRIVTAIERRDPEAARHAMVEHNAHLRYPGDAEPPRSVFDGLTFS